MARKRVHEGPAQRQAEYRKRQAEERKEVKKMQTVNPVSNKNGCDQSADATWFAVKLSVWRPDDGGTGEIKYILSGTELDHLRNDIENYHKDPTWVTHWTYAIADTDGYGTPGMATLHLMGIRIKEAEQVVGYTPPGGYRISESAVRLIRMNDRLSNSFQRRAPNSDEFLAGNQGLDE